jgi:uncharacterized protein (TIGR02145 family)
MLILNRVLTLSIITVALYFLRNEQTLKTKEPMLLDSIAHLETVNIGNQTWSASNVSIPIEGSVCYEDNFEYCKIFGPLYTYHQALEVEKKFPGFRLPTKDDVDILIEFLGGIDNAGKELKVGGRSGFNALLAGFRKPNSGTYERINKQTGFWTSTAGEPGTAWKLYLTIEEERIYFHPVYEKYGDSIRLLKIK